MLEQGRLEDSQKEIARMARESGNALLRIVDDVLDFSRIEAGSLSINCGPMSIHHVVDEALELAAAADRGTLNVDVDAALPVWVRGDAVRLRQVLVNLIENAIKFSSGAGRESLVHISVKLGACDAGRCDVEMVVTDNGIGMDAATKGRLFCPFSQADAGTTKEFGGVGLGLTISQRLASLMGGSIGVDSAPGKGSRFTLRLPFEVVDRDVGSDVEVRMRPAPSLASKASRAGPPILVAEDSEINQQVILKQLSLLGLSADVAETGKVALEMLARRDYVMLLTDLHMPVMDGFELISRIRAIEPTGTRLPIVALTADASEAAAARCRQVGADACLIKPLSLVGLHALLATRMPADMQPLPLRAQ